MENEVLVEKSSSSGSSVGDNEPDISYSSGQPLFVRIDSTKPDAGYIVSSSSSAFNSNAGTDGTFGTGGGANISMNQGGASGARRCNTNAGGDGFVAITVVEIEI